MSIERFSAGGFGPGFYQATDVSIGGETHSISNNGSKIFEFPHPSVPDFPVKVEVTDKTHNGANVFVKGPHYDYTRGNRESAVMNIPVIQQPIPFRSLDDDLGDDNGINAIGFDPVPQDFHIHPRGHI